ncbi:SAV_915 family protein [Streptacidiphilus anmyonensis]|uniref:SAV_915 family protein n=1 Tax=Streptacidiphilus anmyonensis TaxID=405782 RepID=UPI0007C70BCE
MTRYLDGEDPEPTRGVPVGLLLVPVRSGPAGEVLRLFRTPLGERTAVGFTSRRQLAAVLGPDQAAVEIAEPALRAMADALGVPGLTVDPQLAAAPAAALHGPDGWHPWRAHPAPDAPGVAAAHAPAALGHPGDAPLAEPAEPAEPAAGAAGAAGVPGGIGAADAAAAQGLAGTSIVAGTSTPAGAPGAPRSPGARTAEPVAAGSGR